MFDRTLFKQQTPRFCPPAPLQISEIQNMLKNLQDKGHSLDIVQYKAPSGQYLVIIVVFFTSRLDCTQILPSTWWQKYLSDAISVNKKQCIDCSRLRSEIRSIIIRQKDRDKDPDGTKEKVKKKKELSDDLATHRYLNYCLIILILFLYRLSDKCSDRNIPNSQFLMFPVNLRLDLKQHQDQVESRSGKDEKKTTPFPDDLYQSRL
jgi:hypothetical protein